ncbi:MAG: DoxX family membrane protein [Betaproteobacteria bacterium]|nr:DoxX family membrane protein [Betaproteobacteria bacterium]
MYQDRTLWQVAGQLLVAFLFLGTGIVNASTKFAQHLDRMRALGVPLARLLLIAGLAMQLAGGLLLALDWHRSLGAAILIVFTVVATAIFHQYWKVDEPLRRHLHVSFIFSNCGIVGALLLLI